jgi:hypothetical protein
LAGFVGLTALLTGLLILPPLLLLTGLLATLLLATLILLAVLVRIAHNITSQFGLN